MNNSTYDKLFQNKRKQNYIRLATNESTKNSLSSSVDFKGSKCIPHFWQIFEIKKISTSAFIGESVLDLSEIMIWEFYFNYMM